jgi:nucleotide-binding universal stress UspA family protein
VFKIQTVLYATDFSEHSEVVFQLACALARHQGARVIVLQVIPPPAFHGEVLTLKIPRSEPAPAATA